ncbi:MAG: putative Ig domain-containing protein [Burkholderiales bacterium]|nr:putative Ig domain-containing protein [Burkholderiales bacterium]
MKFFLPAVLSALCGLLVSLPTASWAEAPHGPTSATQPVHASVLTKLPAATVGRRYERLISATGGTPPYTHTLTSGNLAPFGLSLSPEGVVSGTPTQAGRILFTVSVRDVNGVSEADQTHRLRVRWAPRP